MYASKVLIAAVLAAISSAAPQRVVPRQIGANAENLELIHNLQLAATAVDRVNMLTKEDFIYDFGNPPADAITTGDGGHTVKADRKVFPALVGTGVGMTLGFIGPCGFNTPHVHPRSSEINVIVQGRLGTQFITENGANPVGINYLEKFQMTVFPQGATHTEFNPDCEPAVFVAGFASEDPGVQQSAQTLFELESDIVQADLGIETLNGESIEQFKANVPANVAMGVESCLKKCGISLETPNQSR